MQSVLQIWGFVFCNRVSPVLTPSGLEISVFAWWIYKRKEE